MSDYASLATPFFIRYDGQVGIGTTNPKFGLDVLTYADESNSSTYWNTSTHSSIGDECVLVFQ